MPRVVFPSSPAADWARAVVSVGREFFTSGVSGSTEIVFSRTVNFTVGLGVYRRVLGFLYMLGLDGSLTSCEYFWSISDSDGVIAHNMGTDTPLSGLPGSVYGADYVPDLILPEGDYSFTFWLYVTIPVPRSGTVWASLVHYEFVR